MPPIPPLQPPVGVPVRNLTLNEGFDQYGRLMQLLGPDTPYVGESFGREYLAPPTEIVEKGDIEAWSIFIIILSAYRPFGSPAGGILSPLLCVGFPLPSGLPSLSDSYRA